MPLNLLEEDPEYHVSSQSQAKYFVSIPQELSIKAKLLHLVAQFLVVYNKK